MVTSFGIMTTVLLLSARVLAMPKAEDSIAGRSSAQTPLRLVSVVQDKHSIAAQKAIMLGNSPTGAKPAITSALKSSVPEVITTPEKDFNVVSQTGMLNQL